MKLYGSEGTQDFERYYDLRWRALRIPWHQPGRTEKDGWEKL